MRSLIDGLRSKSFIRASCLMAGLLGMLLTAAQSAAQDRPMPAALLRRVAEAVQGLPQGYGVYVAIDMEFPYEVIWIGRERAAVEDSARRVHRRYTLVGPVEGEEPPHMMSYSLPCKHWADSYMSCPDSTRSITAMPTNVVVIFQTGTQSDTVAAFSPADVDALFFNLSAMDKFVFPYYSKVYGIERAAQMRNEYIRAHGQ